MQVADPFHLDGRSVVLIDTPGFDDTTRSDTDVLKMIAAFLETSYVTLEFGQEKKGDLIFLTKFVPYADSNKVSCSLASSISTGSPIVG